MKLARPNGCQVPDPLYALAQELHILGRAWGEPGFPPTSPQSPRLLAVNHGNSRSIGRSRKPATVSP
jgi:hypothetical protein